MCGWVRDGEVCEFAGGERSSRSSDAMKRERERERERERMFVCFIHLYIYIYIYNSVSVYIVLIIVVFRVWNLIVIFFLRVVVREDDNFR